MALLATTAGTILAFPMFLAARNLMKSRPQSADQHLLSVLGANRHGSLAYIVNQIGIFTIPLSENIFINLVSVVATRSCSGSPSAGRCLRKK